MGSRTFNIPKNLKFEKEFEVKEENLAKFLGSGNVNVLATPYMIAWMEHTARVAVDPHLPSGYTTVGFSVNVKHLNPAPLGSKVKVSVELVEIDGRRLKFKVKAMMGDVVIGEGYHERFIINLEKFQSKVEDLS